MFHFHILGMLTLQLIALIGAFFFKAHVQRHELDRRFQIAGRYLVIAMYVVIILTIAYTVIYHLLHGCPLAQHSMKMIKH